MVEPSQLSALKDEELAALVQKGNADAFGVLLNRYQPKLLRYGKRFLASEENITDTVQDIFIRAYQNMQSFDPSRAFSPWIYRVAHNAFVNALRKKQRDPIATLDLDAFVSHPSYIHDPEHEEEKAEMQALMAEGIEALSPAYREIIALHYIEDLSYQEIADVLHVPMGTVGVRLHRAREALKKNIEAKQHHGA